MAWPLLPFHWKIFISKDWNAIAYLKQNINIFAGFNSVLHVSSFAYRTPPPPPPPSSSSLETLYQSITKTLSNLTIWLWPVNVITTNFEQKSRVMILSGVFEWREHELDRIWRKTTNKEKSITKPISISSHLTHIHTFLLCYITKHHTQIALESDAFYLCDDSRRLNIYIMSSNMYRMSCIYELVFGRVVIVLI